MNVYLRAYEKHKDAAHRTYARFVDLCEGVAPPRVPGMDTVIRLAWRIECGRSEEDAAAREYLYRWNLAIRSAGNQLIGDRGRPCAAFGVPHTTGL